MAIKIDDSYRCLFASTADGVVISDSDGVITDCNRAFAALVGRKESEIVGDKLASFIDGEALKSMEKASADQIRAHADTDRGDENKGHILQPQMVSILSGTGSDLTMPIAHSAISRAGNEVGGGTLTIVYIIQAHSVQQAQTEFVSTVSHELRTPLTSIKGFADTILRAGDRLDVTQQRRYIGIIKDQADRLTRLVEDLLAVSRLESKKMQLTIRAIDLNEAVQRVLRNLTEKAVNHRLLSVIPPGIPPVWADSDRLEQILTNLVDNAIKYSPAKTTVTINARIVRVNQEMVEFSVADQGGGISKENLSEIFNKFSRLDNPLVRQTEGTGLGLYITRSLVLALGGQITVDSEPGQPAQAGQLAQPGRTTFTVRLPAASLEDQAARGRD